MRFFLQIKAILISLFLLFFVLVPLCIFTGPLKIRRKLKIITPVWALLSRILLRYACHSKITICKDDRSAAFKEVPCYGLYIANHQSFLDIPLILSVYQAPPIMKKEVLHIPLFGWMAWISGAIPVSRQNSRSRKIVFEKAKKRILKDRVGIQVYPEGTRSKDALPLPYEKIKKTLLYFAYNEKIPVIPTSIYGTSRILTSSGSINPGCQIGIIVHKEIDPNTFNSAEDFARECWNKVIEGHRQMNLEIESLMKNLS